MARARTSFRLNLEKLDGRLCLSGTTLGDLALEAPPVEAGHVRLFDGITYAEVAGHTGGAGVGAVDRTGDGVATQTSAALHLKPLTPQSAGGSGGDIYLFQDYTNASQPDNSSQPLHDAADLAVDESGESKGSTIAVGGYIRIKKLNSGG